MGDQCENDRQQLRRAIIDCRERRLIEAAKWAAQQLAGLPRDPAARQPVSAISDPSPCSCAAEEDAYQLALCHFDFRVGLYHHVYNEKCGWRNLHQLS